MGVKKIGKKSNKMNPTRRENSFTRNVENPQTKSSGAFDEDIQVGYRNLTKNTSIEYAVDDLYYGNAFFKRIIDEVPSDSLKKGFKIEFSPDDEKLSDRVLDRFNTLELDNYLVDFIQKGRKDGFSALLPIIKVKGDLKTDEPLELNRINQIIDFNVVERRDVLRIERNKDINKPFYGEIEYIHVKSQLGYTIKYHRSWLLIFETGLKINNTIVTDDMHMSLYSGLYDALQTNYNIGWSTGQYAFASFCKFLQIGDQSELDKIRKKGLDDYVKKKEMEINTTTLAVGGANDKLTSVNLSGNTDFESLQKVSLNDIATRLGIPVSKLMGASAGALASAEQDSERYIEVIEQYQEVIVKDFLRKLINMILATFGDYGKDYKIKFKSIKIKDEKKEKENDKLEAEARKIEAEARKITIETLITLNKEINDSTITETLKKIADRLKVTLLDELDLDED